MRRKCRFCWAEAVAVFVLDAGCFCCPDEWLHAYCVQHVLCARPRGGMELVEILDREAVRWLEGR